MHPDQLQNTMQRAPGRRFAFALIFFTALIDSIGFGIILPVIPELLMDVSNTTLDTSAVYGGGLMFVYAIMQFFFAPVLGNLSDAYGRRPVLLVSLFVLGVNYFIMGLAPTLTLLFVGRVISGIGAATYSTCNAYVADITSTEERAQYFGMMGAAFGMGFVIGPVLGGLLGELGPRIPFFATGALVFVNLLLGFFLLPESLEPENRRAFEPARANPFGAFREMRKFRVVFGIMGVMFLYNLGHFVLPAVWSFYGIEKFDWSPREIGYTLGFVGLLMALVQGLLLRYTIPLFGLRWSGILGFTCMIMAFLGYAGASATWMVYVAMVPGALGALAGPAVNGIASAQVGPDQQGELQGTLASLMSLTAIISPPMMTMTFGFFSGSDAPFWFPGAPFLLAAILVAMSLTLFVHTTRRYIDPALAR